MNTSTSRWALAPAVLIALVACSPEPTTTEPQSADVDSATSTPSATSDGTATTDTAPATTAPPSEPETSAGTPAPDAAGESSGVTGTIALTDTVPAADGLYVWGTPMLDGAEIDVFDQDGYNIVTMPSTCRLTTYQGVFVDPSAGGSDTEGTDRVREVILAGYEQDEDLRSEPVDPVEVSVVGTDSQIEMAGLRVSVRRDGKDLVDTFYYRGMPTADATVFMALSCEQQIIDAGGSEMEQILEQIALNVVQP